jgi:hypothetical protein
MTARRHSAPRTVGRLWDGCGTKAKGLALDENESQLRRALGVWRIGAGRHTCPDRHAEPFPRSSRGCGRLERIVRVMSLGGGLVMWGRRVDD